MPTKPTEAEVDRKMRSRGYRYKLVPVTGKKIDPLYTKRLDQIGPLMRSWSNNTFKVKDL